MTQTKIRSLQTTMPNADGWMLVADTWTYASATAVTVPSGAALLYAVGDKIRLKQGATYKYFYVTAVADTLLTVTGGSDFTVATPTAITDVYYSKVATPVGFPQWFNYAPYGISATNVTLLGRFCVNGRICSFQFVANFTGGITFTTMPSLPILSSSNIIGTRYGLSGLAGYIEAGVAEHPCGLQLEIHNNTPLFILETFNTVTEISATSPITWKSGDTIEAAGSYEI